MVYCFLFVFVLFCSARPFVIADVVIIWGNTLQFVKITSYFSTLPLFFWHHTLFDWHWSVSIFLFTFCLCSVMFYSSSFVFTLSLLIHQCFVCDQLCSTCIHSCSNCVHLFSVFVHWRSPMFCLWLSVLHLHWLLFQPACYYGKDRYTICFKKYHVWNIQVIFSAGI